MRTSIVVLPFTLLCVSCTLYDHYYHPLVVKRDLQAGAIIKDDDIAASDGVISERVWWDGYRRAPLAKDMTEDRSRVIGHKALRDIPANHYVNPVDISQ